MQQQVLLIHGGGDDGYHADEVIRHSLSAALGDGYTIHYPQMPSDEAAPDFGWLDRIGQEIATLGNSGQGIILVGHSLGASMLLKFLSERKVSTQIAGLILLAAPFWAGEEDWVQGLKLADGFQERLPKDFPILFYHCKDDEVASFADLDSYRHWVNWASFVEMEHGGHQLKGGMDAVALGIKNVL